MRFLWEAGVTSRLTACRRGRLARMRDGTPARDNCLGREAKPGGHYGRHFLA
jgi:hypothetical protein